MSTDTQHSQRNGLQQMDAVVIQASGPPSQSLAYRCEPVPEPGPAEVLVEVHAAAVNPLDVANAAGLLGTPLPKLGDCRGRIADLGPELAGCAAEERRWGGSPVMPGRRRSRS